MALHLLTELYHNCLFNYLVYLRINLHFLTESQFSITLRCAVGKVRSKPASWRNREREDNIMK